MIIDQRTLVVSYGSSNSFLSPLSAIISFMSLCLNFVFISFKCIVSLNLLLVLLRLYRSFI